MSRIRVREFVLALLLLVATSILYRYWLVFPILQYLSLWQWRTVAIVVAVILGALSSLIGLRTQVAATAITLGLLLGGTWTAYSTQHDVRTSLPLEFMSHLRAFWREVLVLLASAVISQLCGGLVLSRYARDRRLHL